ncbi:hypothetical protein V1477_008821 [Vespula maculifrons]|uniref:Uncharacterized protein n=1 Tax=Vespula maculifrons TaxID=7453 RepID=A0ABD2CE32_VESMC
MEMNFPTLYESRNKLPHIIDDGLNSFLPSPFPSLPLPLSRLFHVCLHRFLLGSVISSGRTDDGRGKILGIG